MRNSPGFENKIAIAVRRQRRALPAAQLFLAEIRNHGIPVRYARWSASPNLQGCVGYTGLVVDPGRCMPDRLSMRGNYIYAGSWQIPLL